MGTAFVVPTDGQLYDPTDGAVTVPTEVPDWPYVVVADCAKAAVLERANAVASTILVNFMAGPFSCSSNQISTIRPFAITFLQSSASAAPGTARFAWDRRGRPNVFDDPIPPLPAQ